ncbi:hypothetical protein BGZ73_002150 [Actinomortierella ambigua]|nr:hypothetical protein BGZ73_002150 [Actinomortierella ambigua]
MLKKKRFSGLFGTSVTEIPSPNPEQQSNPPLQPNHSSSGNTAAALNGSRANVGGGVGAGGQNPRATMANQGRQMSLGNLLSGTATSSSANGMNSGNGHGVTSPGAGMEDSTLSRNDVHSSLESLKKLVVAAESYRELATSLAKSTKQLGKCFRDYGETKGMDNTHVMCLMASATFYETFAEMQKKLKDEKIHDELLQDLDEKIKKISLGYDKKAKKPDPSTALVSHEKYIASLSELQESIATANRDHRNNIARRERYTHSLTAQVSCRMAEAQYLAVERQLRGSGPSVVKIKEWAPYAALEMPQPTLVSDGEPTIQIKNISYDEYTGEHIANHSGSTNSKADSGVASMASSNSTPSGTVVAMSDMPPITLPPFEPMLQQQQHQQQQLQNQQRQQPMQQQPSLSGLPSSMPDARNYVTKPAATQSSQLSMDRHLVSPTTMGPLPTTMPVPMPPPAPSSNATASHSNLMKDPIHGRSTASSVISASHEKVVKDVGGSLVGSGGSGGGAIKRIESKSTSSEISPQDSVSVVGLQSPAKTPGAFPDTAASQTTTIANLAVKEPQLPTFVPSSGKGDGPSDKVPNGGSKHPSDAVFHRIESQDSRSGPFNLLSDKRDFTSGSNRGGNNDHMDREAMDDDDDRHRDSRAYLGRFTHPDDDEDDEPRERGGGARRHELPQNQEGYNVQDMYSGSSNPRLTAHDDIYSPPPFENPYYEEDQEMYARLKESARYYDDDEPPPPGPGATTGGRGGGGDYFQKPHYDSDRSYEYGASSAPTGYAREQYPTVRDTYPSRPTLEDRERDLERMNQQKMEGFKAGLAAAAAAAAAVSSTSTMTTNTMSSIRPPPSSDYSSHNGTHRTDQSARATGGGGNGTVASLRRRFSDLTVSDMNPLSGPASPTMGPRGGGGMSGYGDDGRRDNRHPPRVSTPQSRAVLNATSPPPPVAGQYRYGLSKGAASTGNLLSGGSGGVGHERYNRGGGGGADYEDAANRNSGFLHDRARRPAGAGGLKNF